VILYWIDRFAFFVQGYFRKVKYITLVNLLAAGGLEEGRESRVEGRESRDKGREGADCVSSCGVSAGDPEQALFPEYLTCEDKSAEIAGHIVAWLKDPAQRAARVEELAALKAQVAHGGASSLAAEYILRTLGQRSTAAPRPHFTPQGAKNGAAESRGLSTEY
jgi:lipid-A-disaccharide synthase